MHDIKRRLSYDESGTKILRTSIDIQRKSTTCIEDLSNELFYEIFEYCDGFDLYAAFSNLNIRFKELLKCVPFLLKFNVPFQTPLNFQNVYDNVIVPNRHRIISFSTLVTRNPISVLSSLNIDSSFNCLESLVLWERRGRNILPFLHRLTTLPRLSSLRLYVNPDKNDDDDPYIVILSLPVLTYFQISIKTGQSLFYLWPDTTYQLSPLQYLIMDHPCISLQLITLLSCTPQLRHLHCRVLSRPAEIIYEDVKIKLVNLTHFSISQCDALFDEFEMFSRQIGLQLQVLRFATSNNVEYLNAQRWEQLFVQYMPNLRVFEFKYDVNFGASELSTDGVNIVEFISSFWIERQWVCEFNLQIDDWEDKFITFSIHPYKEKRYQLNDSFLFPSVILNRAGFHIDWNQFSIDSMISLFVTMQINHLVIDCPNIHRKSLIKLLHSLPHLHTLKLYSLSLSNEEEKDFSMVSTIDTVSKVNLRRINELQDVEFLRDLCPQIEYFEIDYSNEINIKLLVRSILTKTHRRMCQLCIVYLHEQKPDEGMVKELDNMIQHEQLLQNYTITCTDKNLCIKME